MNSVVRYTFRYAMPLVVITLLVVTLKAESSPRAKRTAGALTQDEAWSKVLANLAGSSEQLKKEMAIARTQAPHVLSMFQALVGSQELASRRLAFARANAAMSPTSPGFTPWPPEPIGGSGIPDAICVHVPTTCKCINDHDRDACIELVPDEGGNGGPSGPFAKVRTCSDISTEYCDALRSALTFCDPATVTSRATLKAWIRAQQDISRLWQELFDYDCLSLNDFISIANDYGARPLPAADRH